MILLCLDVNMIFEAILPEWYRIRNLCLDGNMILYVVQNSINWKDDAILPEWYRIQNLIFGLCGPKFDKLNWQRLKFDVEFDIG
jgi:hypothetical protein